MKQWWWSLRDNYIGKIVFPIPVYYGAEGKREHENWSIYYFAEISQ